MASLLCPIRWLTKQSRCADFSHRSSGQWGLSTFQDIRDMISLWFPWGEIPQSPLQILKDYWEPEKATTIPVQYVSQKCGCEIAMCFLGHRSRAWPKELGSPVGLEAKEQCLAGSTPALGYTQRMNLSTYPFVLWFKEQKLLWNENGLA